MRKFQLALWLALLGLMMTGCATKPELLPGRAAGNPANIDLSGRWALRMKPGTSRAGTEVQKEAIWIPSETTGRRQQGPRRSSNSKRSSGPSVHVFIETGKALKITQTEHGLFISFDRAIVEEYTFGENRTVSVGPIEAQRVSGWDGSVFVVETRDERGVTLRETWAMDSGGTELVRSIVIADKKTDLHSVRQVFDRS